MSKIIDRYLLIQDRKREDLTKSPQKVKSVEEIKYILSLTPKELEKFFDIKIRNGQHVQGMRDALNWVIS